jgi:hypothetical protein
MIYFFKSHPVQQAMTGAAKPADLVEGEVRRNPGEPSAAQAEAGAYKKPTIQWRGLTLAIENPAGSVRRGVNRSGQSWEIRMTYDYGEVVGSMGVDGDPVDIYMGPNPDAPMVYVVHQNTYGNWTKYDEDKCMLGFDSQADAEQAFLTNYTDKRFLGPVTAMPVDEFVAKVRATKEKPAMIKAILFFKGYVGSYVRGGRTVQGYQGRAARGTPGGPGQMSLFGGPESGKPLPLSPLQGKDAVKHTPDLFGNADEHGEMPPGRKLMAPKEKLPNPDEVDIDKLGSMGKVDITDVGSENIYFNKDGREYYSKVGNTESYKKGEHDFSPAPAPEVDHPAPMPRSLLSMVPDDKREEWKDLHRQQHELHHYERGQVREKLDRHRSKRNKAESALREAEANLQSLKGAPMRDETREADAQKAIDKHHAEFSKLAREQDALIGSHQILHEKISKLGRAKEKIAAGTGDMDVDWAAMRKRTSQEQSDHEKSMLKMYREHYKSKPMTKAIVFLRR